MRSIAHEFSLSSQIIVQSAREMRASNTKTRKNKTNKLLLTDWYLILLYVFLFVFSLLYFAYSAQLVRLCGIKLRTTEISHSQLHSLFFQTEEGKQTENYYEVKYK